MDKFYHIDRTNRLEVGQTIELIKFNDIEWDNKSKPDFLQKIVNNMFPNGVSCHRNQYFLSGSLFNDTSSEIELIFELVRREKYSDKLSRFESFFGVDKDTLIPMTYRLNSNLNICKVYEVEAEEYSKHDMTLLRKGSNLVSIALAELYWSGDSINNPLYEYLLKPPIKIIREVSLDEILVNKEQ